MKFGTHNFFYYLCKIKYQDINTYRRMKQNCCKMTDLQKSLFELSDAEYAAFQAKLTPDIPPESFIGVRVPVLRKFAKEYAKASDAETFLGSLPHRFYDENMLHGLLISEMKDYERCVELTDKFLPYVDNWAVCDGLQPAVFRKHTVEIRKKLPEWIASEAPYTRRFGMHMLMTYFLDEEFDEALLSQPADLRSDEYYVNMMTAWLFAEALTRQWDAVIPYIEGKRLDKWTHNKAIQKAIESYRITDEQKTYLKTLKITK